MASEKVAMISQPMSGKTYEEIEAARNRAIKALDSMGYVVINTFFPSDWTEEKKEELERHGVKHSSIAFLGRAVALMSQCDAVYFCRGWEDARGCEIEHDVAQTYGLDTLYE